MPPTIGATWETLGLWQKKHPEATGVRTTSRISFVVIHLLLQYLMYLIQSFYHEGLWILHALLESFPKNMVNSRGVGVEVNGTGSYVDNCSAWLRHSVHLPCLNAKYRIHVIWLVSVLK